MRGIRRPSVPRKKQVSLVESTGSAYGPYLTKSSTTMCPGQDVTTFRTAARNLIGIKSLRTSYPFWPLVRPTTSVRNSLVPIAWCNALSQFFTTASHRVSVSCKTLGLLSLLSRRLKALAAWLGPSVRLLICTNTQRRGAFRCGLLTRTQHSYHSTHSTQVVWDNVLCCVLLGRIGVYGNVVLAV